MDKERPRETRHCKMLVKEKFAEAIDSRGLNCVYVFEKSPPYFMFDFVFFQVDTDEAA